MFIKKPIRQSLRDRLIALILFAVLPAFGLITYNAIDDHQTAVAEVNDSANRIVRLAV